MSKLSQIFQNGESSRVTELENLEKISLCLSHLRENSTCFHMIQLKKLLMKLWIKDTEIVFIYLQEKIYYKCLFLKKWLNLKFSTENGRSASVLSEFPT